jgi:hypothetical protein
MRRLVLSLVGLFVFGSHTVAQAAPGPDPVATLCVPPALTKPLIPYEIDLATATPGTRVHYSTSNQVQIVFINKNPFLFDYRIKIEEKALPEPDLAAFFKLVNASSTAPLLTNLNSLLPNNAMPPLKQVELPNCKTAGSMAITALSGELGKLVDLYTSLKQQAETSAASLAAWQKGITAKEEKLKDANAGCEALVRSATDVTGAIDEWLDESRPGFGQTLKSFKAGLDSLKMGVSAFEVSIAAQQIVLKQQMCLDATIVIIVAPFKDKLKSLQDQLDPKNEQGLQKAAANFDAAVKELSSKHDDIAAVLKDPRNFQEVRTVGDYDEITLVTITVDRKKREEKDFPSSAFLTQKLRFGGRQRFALAMGAAFSGIDTTSFKVVQGLPLNQDGTPNGTTAARVVAIDEQSNQRLSPLVMLHTRLYDGTSSIGFHFSLGFAGSTGNNGVNLEYLVGPSISFGEERFFLTFGAYNGRTQRLQNGFWVGKALPDSVPDVPVIKGRSWDWGVAATYKVR